MAMNIPGYYDYNRIQLSIVSDNSMGMVCSGCNKTMTLKSKQQVDARTNLVIGVVEYYMCPDFATGRKHCRNLIRCEEPSAGDDDTSKPTVPYPLYRVRRLPYRESDFDRYGDDLDWMAGVESLDG